jgi:hypothetical protein
MENKSQELIWEIESLNDEKVAIDTLDKRVASCTSDDVKSMGCSCDAEGE